MSSGILSDGANTLEEGEQGKEGYTEYNWQHSRCQDKSSTYFHILKPNITSLLQIDINEKQSTSSKYQSKQKNNILLPLPHFQNEVKIKEKKSSLRIE